MRYRVIIGKSYTTFSFVFDSMVDASVFMETCLKCNDEDEFACKITIEREMEEDAGEQNGE